MLTQALTRELAAPFEHDIDVMLTPTVAVEPPRCGAVWEETEADPLIAVLNCYPVTRSRRRGTLTGLPALSLPLHRSPSGLPVGVQLVAGPWQEATLLNLVSSWKQRNPGPTAGQPSPNVPARGYTGWVRGAGLIGTVPLEDAAGVGRRRRVVRRVRPGIGPAGRVPHRPPAPPPAPPRRR